MNSKYSIDNITDDDRRMKKVNWTHIFRFEMKRETFIEVNRDRTESEENNFAEQKKK